MAEITGGELPSDDDTYTMPYEWVYTASLGLLCIAIITGNILVLLTFSKDKSLRNSTGLMIMSLAICDLITGAVAVPSVVLTLIDLPVLHFMREGIGCHFSGVSTLSTCTCSLLLLALISIQRFFLITRPHCAFATDKRVCGGAIALVYLYSFSLSFVALAPAISGYVLHPWSITCTLDIPGDMPVEVFTGIYVGFTWIFAGVSICLAQVGILREVCRRTQTSSSRRRSRQLQEKRRTYATKMICSMVAGYLLCTIPLMGMVFMTISGVSPTREYAAIAPYFTWFNSILNPVIYCCFNRSYRSSFGAKILSRRRKKDNDRRSVLIGI